MFKNIFKKHNKYKEMYEQEKQKAEAWEHRYNTLMRKMSRVIDEAK